MSATFTGYLADDEYEFEWTGRIAVNPNGRTGMVNVIRCSDGATFAVNTELKVHVCCNFDINGKCVADWHENKYGWHQIKPKHVLLTRNPSSAVLVPAPPPPHDGAPPANGLPDSAASSTAVAVLGPPPPHDGAPPASELPDAAASSTAVAVPDPAPPHDGAPPASELPDTAASSTAVAVPEPPPPHDGAPPASGLPATAASSTTVAVPALSPLHDGAPMPEWARTPVTSDEEDESLPPEGPPPIGSLPPVEVAPLPAQPAPPHDDGQPGLAGGGCSLVLVPFTGGAAELPPPAPSEHPANLPLPLASAADHATSELQAQLVATHPPVPCLPLAPDSAPLPPCRVAPPMFCAPADTSAAADDVPRTQWPCVAERDILDKLLKLSLEIGADEQYVGHSFFVLLALQRNCRPYIWEGSDRIDVVATYVPWADERCTQRCVIDAVSVCMVPSDHGPAQMKRVSETHPLTMCKHWVAGMVLPQPNPIHDTDTEDIEAFYLQRHGMCLIRTVTNGDCGLDVACHMLSMESNKHNFKTLRQDRLIN